MPTVYRIHLPQPHQKQAEFIHSPAKRKVIKAGRRGGKTVGMGICAVESFLAHKRVLYAAPTAEQIGRFWVTVSRALDEPISAGVLYKNETEHIIELPKSETRIKAKTAWNANTLRGDYADVLILDEFQLMNEDAWGEVGAPMMADHNGDAVFIFTPPSLHSHSITKARDPHHVQKMFKKAQAAFAAAQLAGRPPRWQAFHFTSFDNPHISAEALQDLTEDMTALAYSQEIMAEDSNEAPGALWHRQKVQVGTQWVLGIEENRVWKIPELVRVVVGVDPSGSSQGNACGIVGAGIDGKGHHYTLEDNSIQGSPDLWAKQACTTYHRLKADVLVAEINFGGEMVEKVIRDTDPTVNIRLVTATRGKAIRAEPVSAMTERGTDHLAGHFPFLEDEMCQWVPGDRNSPNRLDAKVWADTDLMAHAGTVESVEDPLLNW